MKRPRLLIGILALWVVGSGVGAWFAIGTDSAPASQTGVVPASAAESERESGDPLTSGSPLNVVLEPEAPQDGPIPIHHDVDPIDATEAPDHVEESKPTSEREDAVAQPGKSASTERRQIRDLNVGANGTLTLPSGEVAIDGNLTFELGGTLNAANSTLILDGADQTITGPATAGKIVMRGGTKRIRGTIGTNSSGNAEPGKAQLYVEAGTTLIIEAGGKWNTPNPYGFQIAGDLVIDGGEFSCRFTNGNGTDRGEDSWLPGSTLTIYSGKFVGNGDADFSGATITIHDGALEINDDIWNSGDALNIYGGLMRNTTGGGMFSLSGMVNVRDGKLQVYQNGSRSLRITKEASVYCTGGEVSINGRDATGDNSGIVLANSATVPDLVINVSTRIHKNSAPEAYLSVSGDLKIAKGQRFEAKGFNVIASFLQTDDQGEFIP